MKRTTTTFIIILTLLTIDAHGQDKRILNGITTDGHRNGLLAINVMIKGTATATLTDICGRFSIPVDGDKFTLLFHGMSYDDLRTYEIELTKNEVSADTLVFQLGHWKAQNPDCDKVNKRLKRKLIE